MTAPIRYGLIGTGFIASRHVKAIRETGGDLAWVCDNNQSRLVNFFETFHGYDGAGMLYPKATNSYWEMEGIDYVVICAPNHLHAEMMRYFLPLGVKVIVEKPPVILMSDFENLKDQEVNVMLQLRYHPEMKHLKEYGKTGKKKGSMIIRVKRDDSYWNSWKGDKSKSGGLLFNLGIHYLDALLYCFGEDVSLGAVQVKPDFAALNMEVGGHEFDVVIEVVTDSVHQTREILLGDEVFQFSKKDNLSFEDLHTSAYRAILNGDGIKLKECEKLLSLICYLESQ